MRALLLAGAASLAASAAAAQTPPPPCQDDVYRDFDFWVGEWIVTAVNAQGETVKAGENVITKEENGCLLVERWTNVQGGTGQSYNFYDPGAEKWRQVWVSPGITIDYAGGLNDEGAMALEGEIAYHSGITAPFRGTWTLNEDASVTQYFQQYDAEKEEWADWFTGTYRRKDDRAQE